MEVSISHSSCTEVQKKSGIWEIKKRYGSNIEAVMRLQTRRDNRSTRDARPHTYVVINTTEYKCIGFYGILKRKKYTYDFRKTRTTEI